MKKIVLFALGLVAVATAHAQDEKAKVETTVAADFVTNYIWRGLDCGNISVQPTLGIGYKGLSLSAWGSVGFTSTDTKEFDLTLAYTIGGFNIGTTTSAYSVYSGLQTSLVTMVSIRATSAPTVVMQRCQCHSNWQRLIGQQRLVSFLITPRSMIQRVSPLQTCR